MQQIKRKLLMAGLSLTVAVVMMVTASLAWMTISTSPEVSGMQVSLYTKRTLLSSVDNSNYVQYMNISDKFKDLAPLRPTSTVDGKNWFIPAYQDVLTQKVDGVDDGMLLGADKFTLVNESTQANVANSPGATNYYVYADFWIKTEEEACNVRLSVPDNNLQTGEDGKLVGTYVLAAGEQMTVNGNPAGIMSSREVESCVRIGFQFVDPTTNTEKFIIYEPNADQRSDAEKPTHTYVHGYQFNADQYKDGNYIKTQPIGLSDNKGTVTSIDPQNLIIQKTSVWNETAAAEDFKKEATPKSDDVKIFGKFLSADELYQSNAAVTENLSDEQTASGVLLQLKKDQPVKIRLYIWLEGQDVDCWNDVAAGSFVVNLELAGETVNN